MEQLRGIASRKIKRFPYPQAFRCRRSRRSFTFESPVLYRQYSRYISVRTLRLCHGLYGMTNYTSARGRSRWLGPQEAGSTPLKLELRPPSARKTTRRQYEPPPTPRSSRRRRRAEGEVAKGNEPQPNGGGCECTVLLPRPLPSFPTSDLHSYAIAILPDIIRSSWSRIF